MIKVTREDALNTYRNITTEEKAQQIVKQIFTPSRWQDTRGTLSWQTQKFEENFTKGLT